MNSQYKVLATLETLLTYYLVQRDIERTVGLVEEDVYSVGISKHEIATNKKELVVLLEDGMKAFSTEMKFLISNYVEKNIGNQIVECFCKVLMINQNKEKTPVYISTRLTAIFKETQGIYKVSSIHLSSATKLTTERECFALKYGFDIYKSTEIVSHRKLVELISEVIPGGVIGIYLEPGLPIYVINDELLGMMGYAYEELLVETKGLMINTVHKEDMERVQKTIIKSLQSSEDYEIQFRLRKKDHQSIWVHTYGKKIISLEGKEVVIGIVRDISKSRERQRQLRKEATLDSFLPIYNRKTAIKYIEQRTCKGSLLLMDIDNFKKVNDYYGHQAGDQVLQRWAEILMKNVRSDDIVARLGGDEFIVYLNNINEEEKVSRKARYLCKLFKEEIASYPLARSSISIGVACGNGKESFADLYECADQALYEVKYGIKGNVKVGKPIYIETNK